MPRSKSKRFKRTRAEQTLPEDTLVTDPEKAAEAFEVFYTLGTERTLEQVAECTGIPIDTITEMSELFQWTEKVNQRNKLLHQAFTEEYQTKSMGIRNRIMSLVSRSLRNMEQSTMEIPFEVTNVNDFAKLARAYETMVRANVLALKVPGAGGKDDNQSEDELTWADIVSLSEQADKKE